jgi:hypothetical protein
MHSAPDSATARALPFLASWAAGGRESPGQEDIGSTRNAQAAIAGNMFLTSLAT